jgi:hypothetical protein
MIPSLLETLRDTGQARPVVPADGITHRTVTARRTTIFDKIVVTGTGPPDSGEVGRLGCSSGPRRPGTPRRWRPCAAAGRNSCVPVAKLKDNKVPALALIGELDPLKKGFDLLEGNVPNLKIVVIKGAGHLDAFRKEQFISELKSFLAAHPADAAAANGANGVNGKFRKSLPAVPSRN